MVRMTGFEAFYFLPTASYYSLCKRAQKVCRYNKTAKRNSMNGELMKLKASSLLLSVIFISVRL